MVVEAVLGAGLWSEDAGLDAERALEMLDRSE